MKAKIILAKSRVRGRWNEIKYNIASNRRNKLRLVILLVIEVSILIKAIQITNIANCVQVSVFTGYTNINIGNTHKHTHTFTHFYTYRAKCIRTCIEIYVDKSFNWQSGDWDPRTCKVSYAQFSKNHSLCAVLYEYYACIQNCFCSSQAKLVILKVAISG